MIADRDCLDDYYYNRIAGVKIGMLKLDSWPGQEAGVSEPAKSLPRSPEGCHWPHDILDLAATPAPQMQDTALRITDSMHRGTSWRDFVHGRGL